VTSGGPVTPRRAGLRACGCLAVDEPQRKRNNLSPGEPALSRGDRLRRHDVA
jgi:hypothetical protein